MTDHHLPWRVFWPWLLICLVLAVGPLIGACSPASPQATPTPTKTPRSAAAITPPPTETASVPPTEAATPTVAATEANTAAPSQTAAPSAGTAAAPAAGGQTGELMTSPAAGVQAFLWWREEVADRDLQAIRDAGFDWVKQYFSWQDIEGAAKGQYDWTHTDRIVQQVNKYGLKLVVRVSSNPDHAFWGGNPPESTAAFTDFVSAVAQRYKGHIQAYQIWNEPNLAREWGNKKPDPAAYAAMLKASYAVIKAADPQALVITAGMAPTTRNDDVAMPDIYFYQGMYDAMKKNSTGYFDMLGAHGTGWAVAPETDPQVVVNDPKLHNNDPSAPELLRVYAFRHIEDVRAVMVKNGDSAKRLAILEFGWTTDNRPNSPYYWYGAGAGITDFVQGDYLVRAFKYAAANWQPWIGLMTVIYMPDVSWTKDDEQFWWSIIGPGYPDFYSRPPYIDLCIYFNGLKGAHCKDAPPQS
jgi:polysaccharide biosynthesis protein PslG